jgi:hypothetical protein
VAAIAADSCVKEAQRDTFVRLSACILLFRILKKITATKTVMQSPETTKGNFLLKLTFCFGRYQALEDQILVYRTPYM